MMSNATGSGADGAGTHTGPYPAGFTEGTYYSLYRWGFAGLFIVLFVYAGLGNYRQYIRSPGKGRKCKGIKMEVLSSIQIGALMRSVAFVIKEREGTGLTVQILRTIKDILFLQALLLLTVFWFELQHTMQRRVSNIRRYYKYYLVYIAVYSVSRAVEFVCTDEVNLVWKGKKSTVYQVLYWINRFLIGVVVCSLVRWGAGLKDRMRGMVSGKNENAMRQCRLLLRRLTRFLMAECALIVVGSFFYFMKFVQQKNKPDLQFEEPEIYMQFQWAIAVCEVLGMAALCWPMQGLGGKKSKDIRQMKREERVIRESQERERERGASNGRLSTDSPPGIGIAMTPDYRESNNHESTSGSSYRSRSRNQPRSTSPAILLQNPLHSRGSDPISTEKVAQHMVPPGL